METRSVPRSPSQATQWRMILLLWSTGLLAAAQFAKITFTIDALQDIYPAAPVPLAVSAVSVMGILGGAVAGFLVAFIGARRSVLLAAGISAVVSLVQGLEMPFAWFMASRITEGVGHLLFVVALPTMMVVAAKPSDKGLVMGLWGTFFGVGYALMGLVVPWLEARGGVGLVYIAHGGVLAALFPLLWVSLPRIIAEPVKMPDVISLHRAIYTTPRYFAPGLGHGLYTAIFIALVAFLPAKLDALWLAVVLPLANLSGTFVSGFVARRFAASKLSIAGFGTAGVLFALMALTGSVAIALCALLATGLTAGANFAAVPELNENPVDQARANGAMAQMGNIGTFSGTPLYALVAGSLWGIAGISIALCVAGVLFAGFAYKTARQSAR